MKKILFLSGLLLCTSSVFAAENQRDKVTEGKRRNEDLYERILQQTGWIDAKENQPTNRESNRPAQIPEASPSKSS
jgi:hypothetical protein